MTLGRAQVVSGQVQVLGNERRALTVRSPPRRQRSRDTSVEQAAPCQSRLLVDERAKLLMREGVRGLGARRLRHHAAGRQLLQRSDRLLVAAPARVAHRVQVEGPPDGSRGAKHLARHVAQSRQSPVEQASRMRGERIVRGLASRVHRREVLGHEHGKALALEMHALPELGRPPAVVSRPHEHADLLVVEPGGVHDRRPPSVRQIHDQAT